MSDNKNVEESLEGNPSDNIGSNLATIPASDISSIAGSVKITKTPHRVSSSSERQIKVERAQRVLENAALVSKHIKERRKATAELLGRPFDDDEDVGDSASEVASTMSKKSGYSVATDTSTALSVKEALNIPGISENLANTLKQKELVMERIKQYKEISKRPSLIKSSPISKKDSSNELKPDVKRVSEISNVSQLMNTVKEKENMVSIMQVKLRAMETTILELQEKINEKDQIIEAKNMATSLMSDTLSKKEKDSMLLLEDTKQQMTKMQENFISMETEWKEEKQRLQKEIQVQDEKINSLEEANTILENTRFEVSVAHSKLAEELDLKNKEILQLHDKIEKLSKEHLATPEEEKDTVDEKGSLEISNMIELTKKIELLEQLNCQIRQTNKDLENKLVTISEQKTASTTSPLKKQSPLPARKGKNTGKSKSPWSKLTSESLPQESETKLQKSEAAKFEMLIQSLNKEILEKEYVISQKNMLISELQLENSEKEANLNVLRDSRKEPTQNTADIGITANINDNIPLVCNTEVLKTTDTDSGDKHYSNIKQLETELNAAQQQIEALNQDIDTANKNMIKVKSNHKLKIKQMHKTIENFSKVSDANAEIIKLNEELHQLSQKVAELEEEKGNLQLHLVDYDSGRLTESDVYKKMMEMENLAEVRLKAISLLETQKFDLVQELHVLQQKYVEAEDKLADMSQFQNEQVCSEMKSVQLEEQIDGLEASKKELELIVENLKLDKDQLNGTIQLLQGEKEELLHKLENYIQENIELTDKLEKLSPEKVSSAESIEIVESLTTQEKLELEEYNKGKVSDDLGDDYKVEAAQTSEKSPEILLEQVSELNRKIELFSQEREEVMEKMNKINSENQHLHKEIEMQTNQCKILQSNIDVLNEEKNEILKLNDMLNNQIDELKRERIELMKETVEIAKATSLDEGGDTTGITDLHQDDKPTGEKGGRNKSVKQLTKEILKLKNTIKEREEEIADCQMKILSLEEYQQKQNELMQDNMSFETKIKLLVEENQQLKDKIESLEQDKNTERQLLQSEQYEKIQEELHNVRQEYTATINTRDSRIQELENLLLEYENKIYNYNNALKVKDKELTEYVNQVTKLNDVSHKLKSTIELLEEEKLKGQNADIVKSLNKQISAYQKKITEYEEKLRNLEDEKVQLLSLKSVLENKNINLDNELKKLQDSFVEKQNLIKELQSQQQKHIEEVSNAKLQAKERDEEIHEIKLQLRKESIENEKLRTNLSQKDKSIEDITEMLQENKENIEKTILEKSQINEQYILMETKNKELMEKLKKFAVNIKKKTALYTELENQLMETQKQLEAKNIHIEQLLIQVETLPALQEKVKHADEEVNRLLLQKNTMEKQKSENVSQLLSQVQSLEERIAISSGEVLKLNDLLNVKQNDLHAMSEENRNLKNQIDTLQNKLVEYEIDQKNSLNFITKISSLESDINQKENQISDLLYKLENQEQQLNQLHFGHNAKVQERDLYIENLETEILKYKNRIGRLEESVSIMEDRRHSLERKADQLDTQLQEKQKAYNEYSSHEDELVNRLAVLMDHDRVVEKQLHVIESDNKELHHKIQHLNDENQRLRKAVSDIQEHCNNLVEKASKSDFAEAEIVKYQEQIHDLETNLKRVTHEHQILLVQRKQDIEDLESEFNVQIENAIKEKKVLSEKYEKISDHVCQLEVKLQEYRNNIENLNLNLEDLNKINYDLVEKAANKVQPVLPDYTEQYVNEINKLNSIINNKNQEIQDLNNKTQTIQNNNMAVVSNFESSILDLTHKLQQYTLQIDHLNNELNILRESTEELQKQLLHKEEVIKDLKDKKKVIFEMNIPKTEGMVISSTIEAVNEEDPKFDISSIQSQIVSDTDRLESENNSAILKISEYFQGNSATKIDSNVDSSIEAAIVPKKAYMCYKGEGREDDLNIGEDPFNSDEGWGLGECQEQEDVSANLSFLNDQLLQLKKDKEVLKSDLETSNNKLVKALRKLKELKSNNDMLSKELKLSKELPQSSILDTAIEDELRNNVQELEKKIENLNAEINKERREKEAIRKQNEVFSSANDRWTELKENLDTEIELWKFKFKEVNDKLSTVQWDAKEYSDTKTSGIQLNTSDHVVKEEMMKLETENDELQQMVDQLTVKNKEILSNEAQLLNKINDLQNQVQIQSSCRDCESMSHHLADLQTNNTELLKNNDFLKDTLSQLEVNFNEVSHNYEQLKLNKEKMEKDFESNIKDLTENCITLQNEVKSLKILESEANNKITSLLQEIEAAKLIEEPQNDAKLQADMLLLSEKYNTVENNYNRLNGALEAANNKIVHLESLKNEYEIKISSYEQQILSYEQKIHELERRVSELGSKTEHNSPTSIETENNDDRINQLHSKIQQLNAENDQLLSTVTELRSSVSSAVDQRGFEISELWKQHLAQRESDFQKTEQELRSELSASEAKYEQLLDNVQSSSQEETNKLIIMEQINSLQNKLQDKEEHLHNLQNKYAEVINQLDILRSEIEDEKVIHDNKLLAQQDEYEKLIQELTMTNQQNTENYEQNLNSIKSELNITRNNTNDIEKQCEEVKECLKISEEKNIDLSNQIQIKESEIYQKTMEYTHTLAQRNEEFENIRKQLIQYENKIEEISFEKESELAILRLKIHENNEHYEKYKKDLENDNITLTETLNAKIVECTNLNKNITELNRLLEEQSKTAIDMQMALESQEVEIVALKDELSNLQQNLRASSSKIEKHVTFASGTKSGMEPDISEGALNKELLDAVPRAELDLALYMLHQRDVRCEELTMELTQLLEERDTLQLRLSDSLRSNEEWKSKCKTGQERSGGDEVMSSSQETISDLPTFTVEKEQPFVDIHRGQTSRSSSISDQDGDKPKLQAKLSELRSVKHSRDVRLRHESEQRQMDLRLLQRDVANLPPEAVDQLAQAHHTLSRDSQSTSTVLLNWLRGKSTPKIVHNM
ncbi:uncharacterized protein LOC131853355 [Achroia grisella]|uniref:uncharacterized protein LOC131853355 n=1 Tax=Achroia grisella TaxID=688607 RepID=UPI0027D2D86A|nr:uncharacterized protein LOC131853355 [Achroia grisella]